MNKSLLAIATATCALATIASPAAEAGFKIHFGFGGGFGGSHHHHHRHHYRPHYVVRPVQPKVYVTRKAKPIIIEKQIVIEKPVTTVADAVHNENSSIALASADVADSQATDSSEKIVVKTDKTAVAAEKPAAVAEAAVASSPQPPKKLDCKQFFPSVGMTLTVPCE